MQEQERQQIFSILSNLEQSKKYLPYFSDLQKHPVFWAVIGSLSKDEQEEVKKLCDDYVLEKLKNSQKTKGGQLFNRFVESKNGLFWQFRRMNDFSVEDKDFQVVGKQVETEMFKLEGILTEKMLKQEKGLESVISSFYNLVYAFFPRYNEIEG